MRLSEATIRNLGNNLEDTTRYHTTLESLRNTIPAMAVATPTRSFSYSQSLDKNKRPVLENITQGQDMVMSLFFYDSLEYDRSRNKCLVPSQTKFRDVYKPYTGQPLNGKKLLVWRQGGIGDLLFIQPHLRYLKSLYPDCIIQFATGTEYVPLISSWKFVDSAFTFPISLDQFKTVDYHLTFEGVIERCMEAHTTNAYKLFRKWINIDTPDDQLVPVLDSTDKRIEKKVKKFMKDNNLKYKNFILIQIRSSSPIRTPSSGVWKQIIEPLIRQGNNIVITDGPQQYSNIEKLIKHLFPPSYRSKIFNFSKESENINYSICLASKSKLVIAPDSSLVHIAAGVRTPVFGVYGAFPAEIRMSTYPKADWIEPERSYICIKGGKHCFLHGHKPCPFAKRHTNHLYIDGTISPCYELIDFKLANEKILTLLKGTNNGS